MVIYLERCADLHEAQLMPLPLTVSCFSKIQIGFTFLVPANLGSPRQTAVKRVCVFVRSEIPSFILMLCKTAHAVTIFTQVSGFDCRDSHLSQSDSSFCSISRSFIDCVVAVFCMAVWPCHWGVKHRAQWITAVAKQSAHVVGHHSVIEGSVLPHKGIMRASWPFCHNVSHSQLWVTHNLYVYCTEDLAAYIEMLIIMR